MLPPLSSFPRTPVPETVAVPVTVASSLTFAASFAASGPSPVTVIVNVVVAPAAL